MSWLTDPFTLYLILSVVIALSLGLFVSLRIQQRRTEQALNDKCQELEEEIASFRKLLAESALEKDKAVVANPVPPRFEIGGGMDFVQKERAILLSSTGQPAEKIAAALGLPRNQVELLIKARKVKTQAA